VELMNIKSSLIKKLLLVLEAVDYHWHMLTMQKN